MAYAECETAMLALLRSLTTIFTTTAQVSAKDYSILDKGISRAAVLVPDVFGLARNGPTYDRTWDILIDLFQAYDNEATTMADFETMRAAVILKIDQNPCLTSVTDIGVFDTILISDGGVSDVNRTGDSPTTGPVFKAQRLRATVYQTLRVT